MQKSALILLAGMSASEPFAAERTIDLSIPAMNCPVCPITVRKALEKVPGVLEVTVHFEPRRAAVTFEDTRATPAQLIDATTNAGYPYSFAGDSR